MNSLPSPPRSSRRRRFFSRSETSTGLEARRRRRDSNLSADMNGAVMSDLLVDEAFHLVGGRHGGGTFQAGCHQGTGAVGEAEDLLGGPTGQQSVAECPAEGITGTESVDHIDEYRGDL